MSISPDSFAALQSASLDDKHDVIKGVGEYPVQLTALTANRGGQGGQDPVNLALSPNERCTMLPCKVIK